MMIELKVPVTATAIASHYGELLDGLVIDNMDADQAKAIREDGLPVMVTDTMMVNLEIKQTLAEQTLRFAEELSNLVCA